MNDINNQTYENKYHKYKTKYNNLNEELLKQNISIAISYGKSLIEKPYGWWKRGKLSETDPMWACDKPVPDNSEIKSINCAGLINLLLRKLNIKLPHNKTSIGGTVAYYDYYKNKMEKFDVKKHYPEGTLIGRKYRNIRDQGHVAIVIENNKVLQSFAEEGVNANYSVDESHAGYYYEYAVLPQNWLFTSFPFN